MPVNDYGEEKFRSLLRAQANSGVVAKEFYQWLDEWRKWQQATPANWSVSFEAWLVIKLNEALGGLKQ